MNDYLKFTSLFMAWFVLSLITVTSCHASPKIQVDQVVYDAGTLSEGKDMSHEFILKNVGDQKLIFKPKPC